MARLGYVVLLAFGCAHAAAPLGDLTSPSQAMRDAAARRIRGHWIAPAKDRWTALVASIHVNDTKQSMLDRLAQFQAASIGGGCGGGGCTDMYRLDDDWIIECFYGDRDEHDERVLAPCELRESMQSVWVEPPKLFSGVWTTYFVNGQRANEIHYRDGKYDGQFTSYASDGSRSVEQRYGTDGIDGEENGWYPSGKLEYHGVHRKGQNIGTWTWYNEDGSVKSTKEYPP